MTKTFKPPRGTRDLMPEKYKTWQKLFDTMQEVAERYGYQPIETPDFEYFDMLAAKGGGGEEIKEQIYYFKDKSERELGLRFDMTAPIARVVASNPQLPKPIKYYYISKLWRYERPQRGRFREFWQFGVELIGTKEAISDAEVIAVGVDILKELGLNPETIKIFISHRKVLEGFVKSLGVPENKILDTFRIIDKKEKISREKLAEKLRKCGVPNDEVNKVFDLLELKGNPQVILKEAKETLPKNALLEEGLRNLKAIFQELDYYGMLKFCILDLGIARGLDYYTDTVFEAFEVEDTRKVGSSIFGGGRYDDLIETYGGESTPATGWAMGIGRLTNLLAKKDLLPDVSAAPKIFVATVSHKIREKAIEILQKLRREKIEADIDLKDRSLGDQLSHADSEEIPYVVIVGQRDLKKEQVTVKDMNTGKEEKVNLDALIPVLSEKIRE